MRPAIGQATTGGGSAAIVYALLSAAMGEITWRHAIPILAAGVVGWLWPENGHEPHPDISMVLAAYRHGRGDATAAAQPQAKEKTP